MALSIDRPEGGEQSGEGDHGKEKGSGDGRDHKLPEFGQEENGGWEEEEARASGGGGACGDGNSECGYGAKGACGAVGGCAAVVDVRDGDVDGVVYTESDEDCDAHRLPKTREAMTAVSMQ